MGDCWDLFGTPWPPQALEFRNIINRRKVLDEELKTAGKRYISDYVTSFSQSLHQPRFLDSLRQVDHAHQVLVENVKPFLRPEDLIKNVSMERLKYDLDILKKDKDKQLTYIGKLEKIIAHNNLAHEDEKKIWKQQEQDLFKQIGQLQTRVDQNVRNFCSQASDNVTRKMQQLEQALLAESARVESLKHELQEHEQEIANLRYQNDLLKRENKRDRQNQQSTVQVQDETLRAFEKKSQELQAALEENHQLKQEINILREANSVLTTNISYNHEATISVLTEENSKLKIELFNANQEISIIKLQLAETSGLQKDNEQLTRDLQHQLKLLFEGYDQAKKQLRKQEIANQILHNENEQLKKKIIALREELETRQQEPPEEPPQEEPEEEDEKTVALRQIGVVHDSADRMEEEVKQFCGTKEDKQYLHLKEMLLKLIIKLDNVETGGVIEVREERKIVIKYIQGLLALLKEKVQQPGVSMEED